MSRRSRKRRKRTNQIQGPTKSNISVAGLVLKNLNTGSLSLPKPSIPVAVRDEEEEYRRARQLANDYIERGRLSNRPWFQNPKMGTKYSEDILITPDMARIALDYNPDNRNTTDGSIDAMARDMENKRWISSHQGIGIDLYGNIFDGQHRLMSIIESNTPTILYVTFNCPPEARFVTDVGKKRTAAHQLQYVIGRKIGGKFPAVLRAMMRGTQDAKPKWTNPELAEFANLYGDHVEECSKLLRDKNIRSDVHAAIAKAMLYYKGESLEKLKAFCQRLSDATFDGKGDPAHTLYTWLMRSKQHSKQISQEEVYKKALAAIYAVVNDRRITILVAKDKDVFNWLPGWGIPQQ